MFDVNYLIIYINCVIQPYLIVFFFIEMKFQK